MPDDHNGNGIYAQMKAVKGHPARTGRAGVARRCFSYKAHVFDFPDYWLVTKGTWYVQVEQIDSTGKGGLRYCPVETIHIT